MTLPTTSTPDCCDVWPAIRGRFLWFDLADDKDISVMPSLINEGHCFRVNFCPACGAERRSTVWNRNEAEPDPDDFDPMEHPSLTAAQRNS